MNRAQAKYAWTLCALLLPLAGCQQGQIHSVYHVPIAMWDGYASGASPALWRRSPQPMRLPEPSFSTEAGGAIEEPPTRASSPPLDLPPTLLPEPAEVRELPEENAADPPAAAADESPRKPLDEFVVPGDSPDEKPLAPQNVIPLPPRNVIPRPIQTPHNDVPAPSAERTSSRRKPAAKPVQLVPPAEVAEQQHPKRAVAIRWKIIAE